MKQKILIVDDDETNVAILKELLEEQYVLATASSGQQCLEKIDRFKPDLVLLDILMSGMDGYETCRRIKSDPQSETTHIILISAKISVESRLKGYEVGADDYITKPFDGDELLAKIKVQLRLREALMNLTSMHAQVSLQNTKLEELVYQRTAEVIETRDLVVFALAKLAESRDPETGEHLERICAYSQILTEQLAKEGPYTHQINEQFLEDIHRSSPLHDIGKVGIPDTILLKPGRLSTSEFEIMKRHTTIGAEAIESAAEQSKSGSFLIMAVDIARSHHERFDGTGYPAGLSGQHISLAARIVDLVDVYDAITSVRVYKAAFEPEIARNMIEEEKGKAFDPAIVDAFRVRWEDFLKVRVLVDNRNPELVETIFSHDVRR